jgi:hypothetical protein
MPTDCHGMVSATVKNSAMNGVMTARLATLWVAISLLSCARAPAPAKTGAIRGRVLLTGAPPPRAPIDRHTDPICSETRRLDDAVIVGANGGLKDVFVQLTGSLPAAPSAAPTQLLLEQRQCTYEPRVTGLREGQTLAVKNLDGTLHNVHVFRGTQTLLNRSQKIGSEPVLREIDGPPALLEVKCDVHPWMEAHIFVTDHPWFAVSKDDGAFELNDVPSGPRTLELWHAVYGKLTAPIEVPAAAVATIELRYPAR